MYLSTHQRRTARWIVTATVAALMPAIVAALASPKVAAQTDLNVRVHLPASINRGDFASVDPLPSATATRFSETAVPTEVGPTSTRTPAPTETPVPSPTYQGGVVRHPEGDEIILQIGYRDTDEPREVWEEMNGSPFFTVYGDGRVIAQHSLPNTEKKLFVGQTDEEQIQAWLQALAYGASIFTVPAEEDLTHPGSLGKPILYVYVKTTGGSARMAIPGFLMWERREVDDHPYNSIIQLVLSLAREMETWAVDNAEEPYDVEQYTLIVQHSNPPLNESAPQWEGPTVRHIAEAAPTAQSNYVDRVPGHKFIDGDEGDELTELVRPEWMRTWGIYNMAAEFKVGGRVYSIGIRPEVPGGALFLPTDVRANWYRRDVGSVPGEPRLADPSFLERRLLEGLAQHVGHRSGWPPGLEALPTHPPAILRRAALE